MNGHSSYINDCRKLVEESNDEHDVVRKAYVVNWLRRISGLPKKGSEVLLETIWFVDDGIDKAC